MNSSPVGCSVYTLSLGSICALTSAALVGIAFSTDNWRHISVDRDDIQRQTGPNDVLNVSWALKEDHRYFDRVQVRHNHPHLDMWIEHRPLINRECFACASPMRTDPR